MSFLDKLNLASDKLSAAVTAVQFVENISSQSPVKMSSVDKLKAAMTVVSVLNPTVGAIDGVISTGVSLFNMLGIFSKKPTASAEVTNHVV
jgi:hypothetical protein